ncbi:MAG: glycosyl transferase family [Herbinix sp.]|nr:glycosyl transferase family [Herbinix sp.]
MRILLINYRYFISGGPEKYMFHIKKKLEEEGHEVIPFSIHSNKNETTEYSKYFVNPIGSRDVTYYREYKKTPKAIIQMISRSVYSFEVKRAVKKIITDVKPDIVYILHYVNKLSPSVIKGAKEMGLPVVLRLSDYFLLCPRFDFLYQKKICEDCLTKGYKSCIKKRCVKDSIFASLIRVFSMKVHKLMKINNDVDAFIAPSEFLKKKLAENGFKEEKIHCIPTFTSSQSEIDKPEVGDYGLYFGRITKEKGVETLIHAYGKLPRKYRLVVMGDDATDEAVALKAYINDNKITNIDFIGFKTGIELETVIRNARFTFIPSLWYDNLPNTALEAFQYFKPVIASNIGSLPELVIHGFNGYLFEPGNVEEVIRYIKELGEDSKIIWMGTNGHSLLDGNFSAQTHYNRLMNTFRELLSSDLQHTSEISMKRG